MDAALQLGWPGEHDLSFADLEFRKYKVPRDIGCSFKQFFIFPQSSKRWRFCNLLSNQGNLCAKVRVSGKTLTPLFFFTIKALKIIHPTIQERNEIVRARSICLQATAMFPFDVGSSNIQRWWSIAGIHLFICQFYSWRRGSNAGWHSSWNSLDTYHEWIRRLSCHHKFSKILPILQFSS